MELYNELQIKIRELNASVLLLRSNGTNLAEAEYNYKILLSQEALKLRDSKMPVSMISTVIYGIKEVANLRFKRDVAEVVYNANQENINSLKLQIRILENQIQRELGQTKYEYYYTKRKRMFYLQN